jgi:UDP-glucose 4-epimerase
MKLARKKILVTGGAGFIGSHLVDALIQERCEVRVIDNFVNGKSENLAYHKQNRHFDLIKGDITKPSDAAKSLRNIDVVFHLACLGVRHSIQFPHENHRINAEGTLVMLEKAYAAGVKRFIYCSSSEVYGTAQSVPMSEIHPTFPCTVYGASKLAGEAYARAYFRTHGFPTVIIRPFNTYGPRSHYEGNAGELIPKSILRSLAGRPILICGNGTQTRDFTYVQDIARGFVESAKHDEMVGQTFNIGSQFEISIKDVAEIVLRMSKNPASKITFVQNRPGDVLRLFADATAFHRFTGWRPEVPLEAGLQRTIDWFKARPEKFSEMLSQERGLNWT